MSTRAGRTYQTTPTLAAAAGLSDDPAPANPAPTDPTPDANEDLETILRRALGNSNGGRLEALVWNPDDHTLDLDSWILQVNQSFHVHAPSKTPAEKTDWAILQLRGRAIMWWASVVASGQCDAIFNSTDVWELVEAYEKENAPKKRLRKRRRT